MRLFNITKPNSHIRVKKEECRILMTDSVSTDQHLDWSSYRAENTCVWPETCLPLNSPLCPRQFGSAPCHNWPLCIFSLSDRSGKTFRLGLSVNYSVLRVTKKKGGRGGRCSKNPAHYTTCWVLIFSGSGITPKNFERNPPLSASSSSSSALRCHGFFGPALC